MFPPASWTDAQVLQFALREQLPDPEDVGCPQCQAQPGAECRTAGCERMFCCHDARVHVYRQQIADRRAEHGQILPVTAASA